MLKILPAALLLLGLASCSSEKSPADMIAIKNIDWSDDFKDLSLDLTNRIDEPVPHVFLQIRWFKQGEFIGKSDIPVPTGMEFTQEQIFHFQSEKSTTRIFPPTGATEARIEVSAVKRLSVEDLAIYKTLKN